MNLPRFEYFKSAKNNDYYFRLRSKSNGEIILSSEAYKSEASCVVGINSVKSNCSNPSHFEKRVSGGSYTFVLKARNGEIIGRSESYTSGKERDNGIDAVIRDAPNSQIIEI